MRLSSVDLPEPDAPTIDTISPRSIGRLTFSRAVTVRLPSKVLVTPDRVIMPLLSCHAGRRAVEAAYRPAACIFGTCRSFGRTSPVPCRRHGPSPAGSCLLRRWLSSSPPTAGMASSATNCTTSRRRASRFRLRRAPAVDWCSSHGWCGRTLGDSLLAVRLLPAILARCHDGDSAARWRARWAATDGHSDSRRDGDSGGTDVCSGCAASCR